MDTSTTLEALYERGGGVRGRGSSSGRGRGRSGVLNALIASHSTHGPTAAYDDATSRLEASSAMAATPRVRLTLTPISSSKLNSVIKFTEAASAQSQTAAPRPLLSPQHVEMLKTSNGMQAGTKSTIVRETRSTKGWVLANGKSLHKERMAHDYRICLGKSEFTPTAPPTAAPPTAAPPTAAPPAAAHGRAAHGRAAGRTAHGRAVGCCTAGCCTAGCCTAGGHRWQREDADALLKPRELPPFRLHSDGGSLCAWGAGGGRVSRQIGRP